MDLPRPRWPGLVVMAVGIALIYVLRQQRLTPGSPDTWIPVILAAGLTPALVFVAALLKGALQGG